MTRTASHITNPQRSNGGCFPWIVTFLLVITMTHPLPAEASTTQPLFVIERSKNANILHYDAKLTPGGKLDPREPVVVYWIMRAERGQREDLTWLEKKKAYGFGIEPMKDRNGFRMVLKPVPERPLRIFQDGGEARAETTIGGRNGRLDKLYIKSDETKLVPSVLYIELFGRDAVTGELLHEKIVPRN